MLLVDSLTLVFLQAEFFVEILSKQDICALVKIGLLLGVGFLCCDFAEELGGVDDVKPTQFLLDRVALGFLFGGWVVDEFFVTGRRTLSLFALQPLGTFGPRRRSPHRRRRNTQ